MCLEKLVPIYSLRNSLKKILEMQLRKCPKFSFQSNICNYTRQPILTLCEFRYDTITAMDPKVEQM